MNENAVYVLAAFKKSMAQITLNDQYKSLHAAEILAMLALLEADTLLPAEEPAPEEEA